MGARKRITKQSDETSPPSERAFLRFYYSESLRERTLAVLTTLEQGEDTRRNRAALAEVVLELSDSGMDYYYLRPLRLAKVGSVVEQSAQFGIGGFTWIMAPVIRRIIGRMDNQQVLTICSHIRELMD